MIADAQNTEISLHKCRINRLENIVLYVTRVEYTTLVDFMASRFFAIKINFRPQYRRINIDVRANEPISFFFFFNFHHAFFAYYEKCINSLA